MSTENIHNSNYPDIEIPTDIPLTDFILQRVKNHPAEKAMFIDGNNDRVLKYGDLENSINRIAAGLSKEGISQGDVVCLFMPNLLEYGVIFNAVAKLGAINTTANPIYNERELEHQLRDSNAVAIFTIEAFFDTVKLAAAELGITKLFTVGEVEGAVSYEKLGDNDGTEIPSVTINPVEDTVALPYSSGTTGLSKGVVLTHYNLISNILQIDASEGPYLTENDVFVGVLPFYHIYGLQVILNYSIFLGLTTVVMFKFDFGQFLGLIQKYKISVLHIVPPIVLALAKVPVVDNFDVSSVKVVFSGAAPLGAELENTLTSRQVFANVQIKQGYGMTELSPASHIGPQDKLKSGTVGFLLPNMQCKIADIETGEALGVNQEGEIWVRGPNIMKGYLNNDEATANTIDDDGWLHTGDLGQVDEEGFFTVTDRLKELIKYKGFQVPPAELEELLLSNPDVSDCAVIGVPDIEAGELPKAFIVPRPDSGLTEESIIEWVAERVAPYKKLRGGVEFIEAIPKSGSGKILRRILRDKVKAEQAEQS